MSIKDHPTILLDFIDKGIKITAVVFGAFWTYLNYVRGRTFKRRLEPGISGGMVRQENALLLLGVAQLKNVGLSKVLIEQRGTAIEVLFLEGNGSSSSELVARSINVLEVFKVHGWIESGEQIHESFALPITTNQDTVAIKLKLRIVSQHTEWNADCIVALDNVGS